MDLQLEFMNKRLTISAKDEKILFPAAVRGSKTPVLKPSNLPAESAINKRFWMGLAGDAKRNRSHSCSFFSSLAPGILTFNFRSRKRFQAGIKTDCLQSKLHGKVKVS